jgi:hypothetical protein
MQKPEQEKTVWKDRYENDAIVPPLYYGYPNETVGSCGFRSNHGLFGAAFRPIKGRFVPGIFKGNVHSDAEAPAFGAK